MKNKKKQEEYPDLLKPLVVSRSRKNKDDFNPLTLGHIFKALNKLSRKQLRQPAYVIDGEGGGFLYTISIASDDGINPSGDGCEPRSVYTNSLDHTDREIGESEAAVIKKGTIVLEVETD